MRYEDYELKRRCTTWESPMGDGGDGFLRYSVGNGSQSNDGDGRGEYASSVSIGTGYGQGGGAYPTMLIEDDV
jgi:hypothetical protein